MREIKWYGIKTIYLVKVKGKPQNIDKNYENNDSLIEERVVILKANTDSDAIKKGKQEARDYVKDDPYRNPYGQIVTWEYLEECEIFELYDSPANKVEVFSSTRKINKNVSKKNILEIMYGIKETEKDISKRRKFSNAGQIKITAKSK